MKRYVKALLKASHRLYAMQNLRNYVTKNAAKNDTLRTPLVCFQ